MSISRQHRGFWCFSNSRTVIGHAAVRLCQTETLSEMREMIIGFLSIISLGADFIVSETRRVTVTTADCSCYVYQRRRVYSTDIFQHFTIIDSYSSLTSLHFVQINMAKYSQCCLILDRQQNHHKFIIDFFQPALCQPMLLKIHRFSDLEFVEQQLLM